MNKTLSKQWSGTCHRKLCKMSAVVVTCGKTSSKRSSNSVLTLTASMSVPWNNSAPTASLQQQTNEDAIMDIVLAVESDVQNHLLDVGNIQAGGMRYDQWPDVVCDLGEVSAYENGVSYCRECSWF